VTFVHQHKI